MTSKKNMLFIGLLISICFMFACDISNKQSQNTEWENNNRKEQFEIYLAEDGSEVRHGKYESWYISGNLHDVGMYTNGFKTGTWVKWHDNDKEMKLMEGAFTNGEMDGQWSFWMDHSMHMSDSTPMNHTMHMEHQSAKHADSNGDSSSSYDAPFKVENFKAGVPHGLFLSKYSSGQTSDSMQYINGKIVGAYTSFHENGEKAAVGYYEKGKLKDELQLWDSLGNSIQTHIK